MSEKPLLNGLRAMLHQFTIIEEQAWQDLVQRLKVFEYQKGDIIKKFNSEVTDLHFVMQGIARHYFIDENNEELTMWFSEIGDLSTDYAAFTKGATTIYEIKAITAMVCYSISRDDLNELYDKYKSFERVGRLINQHYLNGFIDRNMFLVKYSAKQKFDALYKEKPHFFNEIPLKYIASYLGITVETLSRLRSNTY